MDFQHEKRDDDGEDRIAQRFQPGCFRKLRLVGGFVFSWVMISRTPVDLARF